MKIKNLIFLFSVIGCIFLSCSKDKDQTPPTLTLKGKNPDTLIVKTATVYPDPGATATDDKDGDISGKIVVAPAPYNLATVSRFVVRYNVEDNAHNSAETVVRTVEVVKADGNYKINATCGSGSVTDTIIVSSNSTYDTLTLNGFYNSAPAIKAALSNGKYVLYNQAISGGLDSVDGEIKVSGTNLTLDFTYHPDAGAPNTCTSPMLKF